jgi:D-alanyl-D-alanine carboxypeptidase/D-alanyl-D-alanine-endopeptidase (penicillin-binding protein 4)
VFKAFRITPLGVSLFLLLAGCAHERAALPPPGLPLHPDTSRVSKPEAPAFPQGSLDTLLTSSSLAGATIAILVVSLTDGKTLYATNPGTLLTPASVQKLLTSAAALYWLSPQFRFRTEARLDGQDLYLSGEGDPSLTPEDLKGLAREVRRDEPGRIRHLILDASYQDTLLYGAGWSPDDAPYPYHPTLSAFVCHHNFVTLTVRPRKPGGLARVEAEPKSRAVGVKSKVVVVGEGATHVQIKQKNTPSGVLFELTGEIVAGNKDETFTRNIADPAWFTGNLFWEALQAEGLRLRGKVVKGASPPGAKTLAVHRSQALADLLRTMNKESDNLYAEQVLKVLGAERMGPPGSAEKGIQAVRMFLDTLGVKPEGCRLVDGSGLSRANALSPEVLVKVLAWMYRQFKLSPEFVSTLPVAGEDGTLTRRLSQASRLSRAKTGTLTGVSSLAGYAVNKRGEVLAFAVLVNGAAVPASEIRDLQDELVKRLVAW